MFLDYYALLDVSETTTQEEIKAAFKQQALKWHPDRNPGQDTTVRMQQINESYLILKDDEARQRYDLEYQRYKTYQQQREDFYRQQQEQRRREEERQTAQKQQRQQQQEYADYKVNDDVLNGWMNNAKEQSVSLAKQALEDLLGISATATKAVANELNGRIGCLAFIRHYVSLNL
jgi:curved DNA-binding protein CbpA